MAEFCSFQKKICTFSIFFNHHLEWITTTFCHS
jgi:hypothetical protein